MVQTIVGTLAIVAVAVFLVWLMRGKYPPMS